MGGTSSGGGMGGMGGSDGAKASGGMGGHSHGGGMRKRQIGNGLISQLFGSGDDGHATSYHSSDPSLKTGFYIGKNDVFTHMSEFINYKPFPQKVFITADIEFVPGRPSNYADAQMGAVSALGCMGVAYSKFFSDSSEQH
jgi:hypothetical protein